MKSLLGVDPGFANFGYGVTDTALLEVRACSVIRTEKSSVKSGVYASDDTFRRTEEIAAVLLDVVSEYGVVGIATESISYPRSASVAAKIAMSWGVVATIAQLLKLPVVFSTPKQIKVNVAGKAGASKEEIALAVMDRFGDEWAPKVPVTKIEHVTDALAAIISAEKSAVMRALR